MGRVPSRGAHPAYLLAPSAPPPPPQTHPQHPGRNQSERIAAQFAAAHGEHALHVSAGGAAAAWAPCAGRVRRALRAAYLRGAFAAVQPPDPRSHPMSLVTSAPPPNPAGVHPLRAVPAHPWAHAVAGRGLPDLVGGWLAGWLAGWLGGSMLGPSGAGAQASSAPRRSRPAPGPDPFSLFQVHQSRLPTSALRLPGVQALLLCRGVLHARVRGDDAAQVGARGRRGWMSG